MGNGLVVVEGRLGVLDPTLPFPSIFCGSLCDGVTKALLLSGVLGFLLTAMFFA